MAPTEIMSWDVIVENWQLLPHEKRPVITVDFPAVLDNFVEVEIAQTGSPVYDRVCWATAVPLNPLSENAGNISYMLYLRTEWWGWPPQKGVVRFTGNKHIPARYAEFLNYIQ